MIAYFNGSFLPVEDIKVSPFDRGFLFADGAYEALRTYNKKLFLYDEHLSRLKRSLSELRINFALFDELEEIISSLIEKNNFNNSEVVVYLQVTRGAVYPRKHVFPPESVQPSFFVTVSEITGSTQPEKGIKVIVEDDIRWSRCDIKSLMLIPSVLAKQKAVEQGADEVVWLRNGNLLEGGHTNFFAVRNGEIITAPLSQFILPGVTRYFTLKICKENNIPVNEEYISLDELETYEEFFISGTTTEVKPVVQIGSRIFNNGEPGKITKQIQKLYYSTIENLQI